MNYSKEHMQYVTHDYLDVRLQAMTDDLKNYVNDVAQEIISAVGTGFDGFGKRLSKLESDLILMKQEVALLKQEGFLLQERLSQLEQDVEKMKQRAVTQKQNNETLSSDLVKLQFELMSSKRQLRLEIQTLIEKKGL